MARLREHHPYQFKLTFPEFNANHIQVIFHNIRSVEKYLPYVKSDFNYCYCDIVLLVETRTKPSSTLELPDFEILSRIDGVRDSNYSYGSLVYVKNFLKPFVNVFHEVHHFGKDGKGIICVDIVGLHVQYKYANIAIIVVYKSPKCRIDVFLDLLQDAVIKSKSLLCQDTFIVGDFNIDYFTANVQQKLLLRFMEDHKTAMINNAEASTNNQSLLDMCFSTFHPKNCHFTQSVISDHKPLWFSLQ